MPLTIRPLDPNCDYPAAADLINGDPAALLRTPEELHGRAIRFGHDQAAWIAEIDEEPVAYLAVTKALWLPEENTWQLEVHRKDDTIPGLHRQCLAHLMREADRRGAKRSIIWRWDDRPGRARVYSAIGFEPCRRLPLTQLDLATFDPSPYLPRLIKLQRSGLVFETITEMEAMGRPWAQMLHAATSQFRDSDPAPMPKFEEYLRGLEVLGSSCYDTSFAAIRNNQIVGFMRLTPSLADPWMLRTGMTGVVPDERRHGLATTLKVLGIMTAQRRGFLAIQSDTPEDHPMLQLNLKLGFRRIKTLVEWSRPPVP